MVLEINKTPKQQEELREVAVEQIAVNPYQPRRHFSQEDLQELAQSIKAVGLIHPPVVRKAENKGQYELISGERRFRAAQLAGLKTIPVIIRFYDNPLSAEAALVENIQRVDLNAIEIAKAMRSLIEQFSLSQEELAQRIGKKRSTIANYLRLLTLPKHIQDSVVTGEITMGHAKAILSLEGFERQNSLFEIILKEDLSVRETEEVATRLLKKAMHPIATPSRDLFIDQLVEKIQERLGTKVGIQGKGSKGRILIDYYSLDDLDRILNILGVENS